MKQLIFKISMGILPILIFFKSFGQINLVPNGDVETITNCFNWVVIPKPPPCSPWLNMSNINIGTYANACANTVPYPSAAYVGVPYNTFSVKNYQYAHSGNGYLAFKTLNSNSPTLVKSFRGYQEVQLTSSLKAGKKYYCGFYVVLTDSSRYATNNIAMSITKNMQVQDTSGGQNGNLTASASVFNYGNPVIKDTQNWVLVSNIYTATGGEQYITIGNFKENNETTIDSSFNNSIVPLAVYCLDDVFVYELNSSYNLQANAGRDTTITTGDSAFIGTYTNGIDSIKWQILNSNNTIDSIRPGFWVHPTANTCYVVTQTVNGYTSSDTVCVTVQPLPLKFLKYELRSTSETRNGINEQQVTSNWFTANEINVSHFFVQRSTNGKDFTIIGKVNAKGASYNEYSYVDNSPLVEGLGVVYYRILSVDKDGKTSFSETRTIELRSTNFEVRLFPNPSKDVVNIECKEGIKEVKIIDCLGREMLRQAQHDGNVHHLSLNINHYPKGLYIVQVITKNGEVKSEKLLIE